MTSKVKPLDLSYVMRHAFLSGVVAARNIPPGEECVGPTLWLDYDPHPNPAYDRIRAAIEAPDETAALRAKLAEVERERDHIRDRIGSEIQHRCDAEADRDEERKLADDLAYSLKAANHYLRKAGYTPYTEATDRHAARRKEQQG